MHLGNMNKETHIHSCFPFYDVKKQTYKMFFKVFHCFLASAVLNLIAIGVTQSSVLSSSFNFYHSSY